MVIMPAVPVEREVWREVIGVVGPVVAGEEGSRELELEEGVGVAVGVKLASPEVASPTIVLRTGA